MGIYVDTAREKYKRLIEAHSKSSSVFGHLYKQGDTQLKNQKVEKRVCNQAKMRMKMVQLDRF